MKAYKKSIIKFFISITSILLILPLLFACKIETVDEYERRVSEEESLSDLIQVNLIVTCEELLEENLNKEIFDDVILETSIKVPSGSTAFYALKSALKENDIPYNTTGSGQSIYVCSINNLSEKEYGSTSGWKYFVNDISPSVGCGNYKLNTGDSICFYYTLTID